MIDYIEQYQRGINSNYVYNLARAANLSESDAEMKIRELFPIVRGVN